MIDALVLNYNDVKTTLALIRTLQTYEIVDNILVVDNASTDDSVERLRNIQNPSVKLLCLSTNKGYGAGNNAGILYLKKEYNSQQVLLCNPDIMISEETIMHMSASLDVKFDTAIVSCSMLNINGELQYNTAFKLPTKYQYIISPCILLSKVFHPLFYKTIDFAKETSMEVGAPAGSMFLFDVDKMIMSGMFDENIFLYGEEIVLGKRMESSGYKILHLNDCSYVHAHSVSIDKTYKTVASKQKMAVKSYLYILKKYYQANKIQMLLGKIIGSISIAERVLYEKTKISFKHGGKQSE